METKFVAKELHGPPVIPNDLEEEARSVNSTVNIWGQCKFDQTDSETVLQRKAIEEIKSG